MIHYEFMSKELRSRTSSMEQWKGRLEPSIWSQWPKVLRRKKPQFVITLMAILSVLRLLSIKLYPFKQSLDNDDDSRLRSNPYNSEPNRFNFDHQSIVESTKASQEPLFFPPEAFPDHASYNATLSKSDELPDIIFIDLESAVGGMTLEGWEDDWISQAHFDAKQWGSFHESKIDFIYTWVNGSDNAFQQVKEAYMLNSTLKDDLLDKNSGINRYRDWEELRYSIRSVQKFAPFVNKIHVLVNAVKDSAGNIYKQMPGWLSRKAQVQKTIKVLSQEEFFAPDKRGCLPTFNSLTIENQLYNTESDTDRVFAMSDDMLLGKRHAASDFYSPLFGTMMSFKSNAYNVMHTPTDADARRFGEKPWLIFTSWLLNRRFGERKRKGQTHFGKSLSRDIMREALSSFPRSELQSACSRFRGDIQADVNGFQIYGWYLYYHYTIERHRETLLWSYLVLRSDVDGDGSLSVDERQRVLSDLEDGMKEVENQAFRFRNYYHLPQALENAGLESPLVHTNILWTSLDGPVAIKDEDCFEFDANECLAHGFTSNLGKDDLEAQHRNPFYSTSVLFERVAHQFPECGDCMLKILLHRVARGLEPLLPFADSQAEDRENIIKALIRYQYTIVEPDALFVMVADAEQVEQTLIPRFVKKRNQVGQLCLNDDVSTDDAQQLIDVKNAITALYKGMLPERSPHEKKSWL